MREIVRPAGSKWPEIDDLWCAGVWLGASARCPAGPRHCLINLARNSPVAVSGFELCSLELQRFETLLNVHPIELRASFLGSGFVAMRECCQVPGFVETCLGRFLSCC